jgi:amino acid adenylation domain-containing protein
MTLCDITVDLASSTPDNVALSDAARSVTYGELRSRTDRLAGLISKQGVRPGEVVLIMLERGVALIEAMIAVWRAGAAFLPVDPASPAAWRSRTVTASGAALCLTASHLESVGVRRVDLDLVDLDSGDVPTALPGPAPDGLAYVIRTSGSTGLPKLATVTHRGLDNVLRTLHDKVLGLNASAVVVQINSPYFDMGVCDVLLALGAGARLEISDGLPSLAEVINSRCITHALLPAALVRTLDPDEVPSLRFVMSSGAVCWTETLRQWASKVQFVNGYGPAETAPLATLYVADPTSLPDLVTAPLGDPVAGVRLHLLDDALTPVPEGSPGQICIAGPNVGLGYLGQPEETARRFRPDPFGSQDDRLYLTGDRAIRRPDGTLEFLGREDFQVKIRGFRVELGEVERALAELPGVLDAVVIADPRIDSGRLLGYVRLAGDGAVTPKQVRAALATQLPAYMVPGIVTIMADWPFTQNGKIDRAGLPLPR